MQQRKKIRRRMTGKVLNDWESKFVGKYAKVGQVMGLSKEKDATEEKDTAKDENEKGEREIASDEGSTQSTQSSVANPEAAGEEATSSTPKVHPQVEEHEKSGDNIPRTLHPEMEETRVKSLNDMKLVVTDKGNEADSHVKVVQVQDASESSEDLAIKKPDVKMVQIEDGSASLLPKRMTQIVCLIRSSSLIGRCRHYHPSLGLWRERFTYHDDPNKPPRYLVVQPRIHPKTLLKARLLEALRLADSVSGPTYLRDKEELPPFVLVQSPPRNRQLHAGAYFGPGTVDIVRAHVDAAMVQGGVDAVFVNASLSGGQQRNLERAWGRPVLDRVGLIIEIFGAHAQTKEAKLQVELAALDYKKSRLVRVMGKKGRLGFGTYGEAEVVSARGRASGGQGFTGGAGETEIQLQRRRISDRRTRLLALLKEVRQTRVLQRSNRHGVPVVAVVGYTNAGKSTLVGQLSKTKIYADDRLFATLDPQLRSVVLPSGRKVLFSDTVGFISDLPTQLVEAFHATLEEVVEADLILHVMDYSAPNMEEQQSTVLQVLKDIGVPEEKLETHLVEAWNKVDLVQNIANDDGEEEGKCLLLDGQADDGLKDDEDNIINEEASEQSFNYSSSWQERSQELGNALKPDIWSSSILHGKVSRVATSAIKGIGLHELLDAIDKKLEKVSMAT